MKNELHGTWWALRLAYGLVPIVAGADKFTNLLVNWEQYLNPLVPRMLHVDAATFMHLVGIIEIAAGILVLTRYTRLAAYVVSLWLVGIAGNLIFQGRFLDVAVRDLMMSLGAYTLARLTEAVGAEQAQPARTSVVRRETAA